MATRRDSASEASEPIVVIDGAGTPVKVKIEPAKFTPELPTSRYWVGLLPEFKHRDQVDVAGVSFQKIITPPKVSSDGSSYYRPEYLGQFTSLSDEDVKRVTDRLVMKVVRGGHIVNLDNAHVKPQPGDEPLAKYLYMVRLGDGYTPNRDPNGERPEAMAQE